VGRRLGEPSRRRPRLDAGLQGAPALGPALAGGVAPRRRHPGGHGLAIGRPGRGGAPALRRRILLHPALREPVPRVTRRGRRDLPAPAHEDRHLDLAPRRDAREVRERRRGARHARRSDALPPGARRRGDLAAARAHAASRLRLEGRERGRRGGRPGEGARARARAGRLRREAAARTRALRRVPREPAPGPARRGLLELRHLSVPVLGRRARHAADGGDGVRRRPGDLRQRRVPGLRAGRRDRPGSAPPRRRRPRGEARAARDRCRPARPDRRSGREARADGVRLGPRRRAA
jgi:hypothetical protein